MKIYLSGFCWWLVFFQSYCLWFIQYAWNVLNIFWSFLVIMQDIYLAFPNLTYRLYCFSQRELSWFTRSVIEFVGCSIYQISPIINTGLYKTRLSHSVIFVFQLTNEGFIRQC